MNNSTRRQFLKNTTASITAASTTLVTTTETHAAANEQINVGLIGCGGRGVYLADLFTKEKNVRLAWATDPDLNRLKRVAQGFNNQVPEIAVDLRQILDDPATDAVIVATPDHWHAPAAILACEAGKHVYVEKPCSHNIREGRLLVEAAQQNKSIVQHGTQVRSTQMMIQATQKLREGIIGDVLISKAWNIQRRRSIGHGKPTNPPEGFNYDLWLGPVPHVPYQVNRVHEGWHWWYDFGTGDMGNDGVHDIDYARWGLGVDTHPSKIVAIGGKYFFDDDQQFPDTQQVAFEYDDPTSPNNKRMLIYEQRLWSTNYPFNVDSGAEFYGTRGKMFLSRRGKVQVLGERNEKIELDIPRQSQDAESHVANFLDSIRQHKKPQGDIHNGHLTTTLCHLGNIATQLGRTLNFDPQTEQFLEDNEANHLVSRNYRPRHWATPS